MTKQKFLDWISKMAIRKNMRFVYTPKESGDKRISGFFVLEDTKPETDVKVYTKLERLNS